MFREQKDWIDEGMSDPYFHGRVEKLGIEDSPCSTHSLRMNKTLSVLQERQESPRDPTSVGP